MVFTFILFLTKFVIAMQNYMKIKLVIALLAIQEYMWEFWILKCCKPKDSSKVYSSCSGRKE